MPKTGTVAILTGLLLLALAGEAEAKKGKKGAKKGEDPYAEYVWPPPPDEARIKLEAVISGRADVEAGSRFTKMLIGASPQSQYDTFKKPYAVAFDGQGRILVTDWGNAALLRFDREERRMDVFGTRGSLRLAQPLGLGVGDDGTIYVADVGIRKVLAFDDEGKIIGVFGRDGDLSNPTDVAASPDDRSLYVSDSKAHRVVVFDRESGARRAEIGERGTGDGQFNFPTSLIFGPEGHLFVVDQINSRIQVFDAEGEYLDQFGELGRGFGQFTRPKDVAVDEVGFIYVTDNAFNNVQLFDVDFSLLTFVGDGGRDPGRFLGASGIAVRGDEFAVVDQMGARLQVFRFLVSKDQ